MINRLFIPWLLLASVAVGFGAGALVMQVAAPDDGRQDVKSITGVGSGVDGSQTKEPEKKGVNQVTIPPETPDPPETPPITVLPPQADTDPDQSPSQTADSDPSQPKSQTVDIEGVEGTEGVDTQPENVQPENTIEIITTNEGTLQSIRGIKGIDTVMLQNLETVLRMQAPPPPPEEGGGGGGRAAAALLTMENDEPPDPEDEVDGREELTEFELEGS